MTMNHSSQYTQPPVTEQHSVSFSDCSLTETKSRLMSTMFTWALKSSRKGKHDYRKNGAMTKCWSDMATSGRGAVRAYHNIYKQAMLSPQNKRQQYAEINDMKINCHYYWNFHCHYVVFISTCFGRFVLLQTIQKIQNTMGDQFNFTFYLKKRNGIPLLHKR